MMNIYCIRIDSIIVPIPFRIFYIPVLELIINLKLISNSYQWTDDLKKFTTKVKGLQIYITSKKPHKRIDIDLLIL